MFAIIMTGGKQFRVQQGDVIDVELLGTEDGSEVEFKEVLFVQNPSSEMLVGKPYVEGYRVVGEVLGCVAGPKVVSFKFKRRKNYHRKIGHRQKYSRVKIKEIAGQ